MKRASLSVILSPILVVFGCVGACNNSTPSEPKPASSSSASAPLVSASAAAVPSASASASASASGATPSDAAAARVPTITDTFTTPLGDLTVTPIHHATFLIRVNGKAIYLDPVSADASYEGLPKADYVFVTDIHGDHMDPAGLAKVKKDDTVVVAPPAVKEKDYPTTIVLKNGETHDFGTFKVDAVPMYNLKRGPSEGKFYHDKGRGNGYVFLFGKLTATAKGDAGTLAARFYVSGDTECTPEVKALKNIDVAFVCMNLPYTMPPAEAAECVNAFKPKVVFPFHYKGSNLEEFSSAVKPGSGEVRKREWY